MAGVYIKGMKMPNGGTIKIEIGYDADGHPMAMTEDYNAYDVVSIPDHRSLVDVVRCKDCKHRFNYDICAYRGDNWFCGYGERRADNG